MRNSVLMPIPTPTPRPTSTPPKAKERFNQEKSAMVGCFSVKTWTSLIATTQILLGAIVFVVGMIGLAHAPGLYKDQVASSSQSQRAESAHLLKGITLEKAGNSKGNGQMIFLASVTFYSFLIILSIATFSKGILLHLAIKQEHLYILKIWRVSLIFNIFAGFIGFIAVTLVAFPVFKPASVTLICNGMWGLFFIWVAKKFQSELEDRQQRAVLLRRPKSTRRN